VKKLNELKGTTVTTRHVSDLAKTSRVFAEEVWSCLRKHFNNDFGDICKSDIELNMEALKNDLKTDRVLSRYTTSNGDIYIISELYTHTLDDGDDNQVVTTVMFVDEY
jgi:hypothetical protein